MESEFSDADIITVFCSNGGSIRDLCDDIFLSGIDDDITDFGSAIDLYLLCRCI